MCTDGNRFLHFGDRRNSQTYRYHIYSLPSHPGSNTDPSLDYKCRQLRCRARYTDRSDNPLTLSRYRNFQADTVHNAVLQIRSGHNMNSLKALVAAHLSTYRRSNLDIDRTSLRPDSKLNGRGRGSLRRS